MMERNRAEDAIKASEANFHNVINRNVDSIIVLDDKGIMLFVNGLKKWAFGSGQLTIIPAIISRNCL